MPGLPTRGIQHIRQFHKCDECKILPHKMTWYWITIMKFTNKQDFVVQHYWIQFYIRGVGARGGSRISSRGGDTCKNCAEQREARKCLGYFVWKITILRQKIIFFPILGGERAGCAPPDSAPGYVPCSIYIVSR